jgi:DegV family protein with EDD domain
MVKRFAFNEENAFISGYHCHAATNEVVQGFNLLSEALSKTSPNCQGVKFMSKVAVVTDSTAYIPGDLIAQYDISVAPQVLIWGEKVYNDGVDITPTEFYERLKKATVMPSTSQVTPHSFDVIYKDLAEKGYDILSILISEKLSGTIASAVQARENYPGVKIEIVDSYATAMALGFQVLQVARAAQQGAGLEECKALAEKVREHTGVVFAVDTLEFLHRGGRIGGGKRFLGTVLQFKPILELKDGRVEGIEQVRTRKKSLLRLLELTEKRIAGRQPIRLATLHANAPDEARELLDMATEKFNSVESVFSEVSPVVGTHAGPGTIGLAFMAGM